MKKSSAAKAAPERQNVEKSALADRFENEILFPLSLDVGDYLSSRGGEYAKTLLSSLGEFADEETASLGKSLEKEGFFSIEEKDPGVYESEPYYRLLSLLEGRRVDDVSFGFETIQAHALFASGDKRDLGQGKDVSPLGYFSRPFSFPCVKKAGRIWMSLVPHEIETMREPLSQATGKIAVLGLGLGYFAFAAAEKDDVSEVVIFEKDPAIIALFQKHLLPHFPKKAKIRVRKKDALDYGEDGPFDFVFADLWHDVEDGLPLYRQLVKKETRDCPVSYWIEDTMRLVFARFLRLLEAGETPESLMEEMPEWAEIIQKCSLLPLEERQKAQKDNTSFRALLRQS